MDVSAAVRAALTQKHDNVSHAVRSRGAAGSRAPGFEDAARDQFLKSFKKTGSASSASDAGEVTDDRERMLLLILLELSSSRLSPKHLPPRLKLIWEKVARKSLSVSLAFAMQSAGRSSDRHYHVA